VNVTAAFALIYLALVCGTFSLTLFLWQWMDGPPTQLSASILLIAIATVFLKVFLSVRRRITEAPFFFRRNWIVRSLPVACTLAGVVYAGYGFARQIKALPHGTWDAWAIWNLHARFLYRGSSTGWMAMFDPALSGNQPEYPLLLPGLVSGSWTIAGTESSLIPALLAIGFAVLSIGILCTAISALAGDERGWLAGLLLLATPGFLQWASSQTADIPIALYILITVVLLQFAEAWPQVKQPMFILAGLSAGLAAWTKNEGLLFVVAVLASHVASRALLRNWRGLWNDIFMMTLGLAPILMVRLAFHSLLLPVKNPVETLGHVASVNRYVEILAGFYNTARAFGGAWDGGIHPIVLVTLFILLYAQPMKKIRLVSLSLVLLLMMILSGYFVVYLFSSNGSVQGYMQNSLNRLWLQLWPASIFILAMFLLPRFTEDFKERYRTVEP
jgi:hypothetical protein